MDRKRLYFHTDPGHGWLAVPAKMIKKLKIENQISCFSYINGKTVYLEEDQDAGFFLDASQANGIIFEIKNTYREHTPIRGYQRFSLEVFASIVGN